MTLLLTQMAIVLLVTLGCGWLASRLGQSRVIGEIAGGILLGPSVLGHLSHATEVLFPVASLKAIEQLSTVGLVIYMFLVGMELDTSQMRKQKATAFVASVTSILIPFIAGAALAHPIRQRFAPHGIGSVPFVLFLGIAMSMTAFPVLVRILEERDLSNTPLGALATICAAFDDVLAWTLLAITLTLINPSDSAASLTMRFVGLAAYLLCMFGLIRPLSGWIARKYGNGSVSYEGMGVTFAGLLISAAATDWAGVHPLFGAFIAGICFPRVGAWHAFIRSRTETLTTALLLPLFFALTGLRTRLDLLTDPTMWLWAGIILVAAVGGKIGGAILAARWAKQNWNTAVALGALLNTRGLVELIVLNIAYSVGAFSPTLFTMLVLMALITTMCTNPILNYLNVRGRAEATILVET